MTTTPTPYPARRPRATRHQRILVDLGAERVSLLDAEPDEIPALDLAGVAALRAALAVLRLALGAERAR